MPHPPHSAPVVRFGVFEADLRTGELRRGGLKVKLQEQPFRLLAALLARPGEVVTYEEFRKELWPEGTFVDFEHSLHKDMNKLREALGVSAETLRFIETLPRHGYRFIAAVTKVGEAGKVEPPQQPVPQKRRSRHRVVLRAVSVGLALLAAVLVWRLREVASPENLKAVPLTSYSGLERQPSSSPDGNRVAFTWNGAKEDNYDIYVKQFGSTGPPLRLTTSPLAEFSPAWSPDDRWIAFLRLQQREPPLTQFFWDSVEVMLIPPLGGPERRLTEIVAPEYSGLSWAPDGKWLAFAELDSPQGPSSIWAISIETRERRRLTTFQTQYVGGETPLGDSTPSISPDGRTLAFSRTVGSYASELYVQRLTRNLRPDGAPTRVTDQRYALMFGIAWTADGRDIVYGAGGRLVTSLWRVPVSGQRTPKRLPYAFPAAVFPAIARTPPRLVYTWGIRSENLWRVDTRTRERRLLLGSTYFDHLPQYSPDGRKIAFQSNRSGYGEVWTCDADGANCVQLTSFNGPQCGTPRWSPDGRWLALDSRVAGQPEIYVIAADGGTPRRRTNHQANDVVPSWSRDGRWIYFASDRSGQYEIWKMPKDGGEAVQVTRSGGFGAFESPDGKHIYYSKSAQAGLFRMPAGVGAEEQVLPKIAYWAAFGVTSKGVYFMPDRRTIQFLDTASGKVNTVATLDKSALGDLAVSPDDVYVVWSQLDRDTYDLMLVEGFR